MKLYYILEDEDFNKNLEFITIDVNKATKFGYFHITLQTLVQTDFRSLEDNFRGTTDYMISFLAVKVLLNVCMYYISQ